MTSLTVFSPNAWSWNNRKSSCWKEAMNVERFGNVSRFFCSVNKFFFRVTDLRPACKKNQSQTQYIHVLQHVSMEWIKHVPRLIFVIVYEDCQGVNALWLSSWRKVSPTGPLTLFLLFRGWCSLWHHHVWLVFYLWGNKGEQNNFINQWSDSPTCSMEGLVSYLKLDVNYWQCLAVSAQHPAVLCPDMCTALWWLARDGPGSAEGVDPVSADSKAEVSLNAFWCKGTSPLFLPCSWCKIHKSKKVYFCVLCKTLLYLIRPTTPMYLKGLLEEQKRKIVWNYVQHRNYYISKGRKYPTHSLAIQCITPK